MSRKSSFLLTSYLHKILQQQIFFALYQPWEKDHKLNLTKLRNQGLDYYQWKDKFSLGIPGLNLFVYGKKETSFDVFLNKLKNLSSEEDFVLLGIHQGKCTYSLTSLKQLPIHRPLLVKYLRAESLKTSKTLHSFGAKSVLLISQPTRSLAKLLHFFPPRTKDYHNKSMLN